MIYKKSKLINRMKQLGILGALTTHSHFNYIKVGGCCYKHCRRATLEEVKELTGYEVKGE